jgi:signal transduction histidine kinase
MLRLDALDPGPAPWPFGDAADPADSDLAAVRGALDDAMRDIRTIAAGLRTPELEEAAPADIARRAVAEHERRSGSPAALTLGDLPSAAPLATKIALYRILSEALSNATRHGGDKSVAVMVTATASGDLVAEVSDKGPGFDTSRNVGQGHLGLAGMRERAELLGGRLELVSMLGAGTTVRAFLPLAADADDGSWAS